METIVFNIKRFDGKRSWTQRYTFPYETNTLLGCLTKIREEQDPTLNFMSACRHGICGSCAIQVNGSAYLACETQLDDLRKTYETDEFVIEPLNNFTVTRDLVIQFEDKAEQMKKVMPWMCEREGRADNAQSPRDFAKYSKATDCVLCGSCASECRELAFDDGTYLAPFMMNKAYRFIADSRDGASEERVMAVLDNNLWKCIHCQQCTSKCPKEIPIAEEISFIRRMVLEMGETKSLGAKHAYVFYNNAHDKGMLDEMQLAVKTEGLMANAKNRVPFAVRMVTSGKLNPFHHVKTVNGIEGVRTLFEYAKTMKED